MTRYNFNCGKFSKNFKLSGLAIASLLFMVSPLIMFLTVSSTILPLFVLGISGTLMIIAGTCLGEQFFLILDFINLIFSIYSLIINIRFYEIIRFILVPNLIYIRLNLSEKWIGFYHIIRYMSV